MTARPHNITFDCADPYLLATFWSQVTGYQEDPEDGNEPGDPEGNELCVERSAASGPPPGSPSGVRATGRGWPGTRARPG